MLDRGMDKDPEARWHTAGELVDRLEQALEAPPPPPPTRRVSGPPVYDGAPRRRTPAVLIAAALIGVIVLGVLAVVLLSGGDGNDGNDGDRQSAKSTPTREATKEPTKTATPEKTETATPEPTDTPTATPTATATPTDTPEPPTPGGGGGGGGGKVDLDKARQLQVAGFNARNQGDYAKDLQLSQQAIAACGNSNELDPCGYALFEKGLSLNRLGRPDEAVPVLEERLARFGDNPDGEVKKELKAAKKAAKG